MAKIILLSVVIIAILANLWLFVAWGVVLSVVAIVVCCSSLGVILALDF